jgi:hypothetical protein
MFSSFASFDIVAARHLRDDLFPYAEHTNLEHILNFARIGSIALAISLTFFHSGAAARAEALHQAAGLFSIMPHGGNPNAPNFDTLEAVTNAFARAKAAGAHFNCDRVLRALVGAVVKLGYPFSASTASS